MGNFISTPESTVVFQTGNMRTKYIDQGVDYFDNEDQLPEYTIHRFLPSFLESKYEALDFAEKFKLAEDKFNIYNGLGNLVSLEGEEENLILGNVGVVCSIGSSSLQAFKLFPGGVAKPILPISKEIFEDESILGDKENPLLNLESLSKYGASSKDVHTTQAVIQYLQENSVECNVIFVNALGYSTLGFNPRPIDGIIKLFVPTKEQKVLKLNSPNVKWNDNKGKTALIHVLTEFAKDNMHIVTRQVKVATSHGIEELSGQWANQGHVLINEPELKLEGISINRIVDLGGGSGTIYSRVERGIANTFGIIYELTFESTDKLSKSLAPNKILDSFEESDHEGIRGKLFEDLSKELESTHM